MTERGKNVIALAFGLVLACLLGEVGLRTYQSLRRGIPFFTLQPDYKPHNRYRLSPFLVFGPRTNELADRRRCDDAYYSAQGFRTRDVLGSKPAGTVRVFALGGSTTEDLDNEDCIHWPQVAQEQLAASGRTDVRVYGAGMAAYTSAHTLVRLEMDVLQYQPDVVLIMDHVNDLSVLYHAWRKGQPVDGNYLVQFGSKGYTGGDERIVMSRVAHSLGSRLRALMSTPVPPTPETYDVEGARTIFKRNLRSEVFIARGHGVLPVLLTMPVCESESVYVSTLSQGGFNPRAWPRDYQQFRRDFDAYNETVREVGRELGVKVIDLRQQVSGDPANFLDTVHHSSAGVRAIGEVVGRELLAVLPAGAPGASRPAAHGRGGVELPIHPVPR